MRIKEEPHWCEAPVMRIMFVGRMPRTLKQWVWFGWNFDIFYGRVPFMKTLAAVVIGIALAGRL